MNYIHVFKSKKPFTFYMFTILVIVSMIFIIPAILGKIVYLLIVIVFLIIPKKGIEINFENRRYRKITLFLNLRFGKWKLLPTSGRIKLKRSKTKESIKSFQSGAEVSFRNDFFLILCIYNNNKIINLYQSNDLEESKKMIKYLNENLDSNILTTTT